MALLLLRCAVEILRSFALCNGARHIGNLAIEARVFPSPVVLLRSPVMFRCGLPSSLPC